MSSFTCARLTSSRSNVFLVGRPVRISVRSLRWSAALASGSLAAQNPHANATEPRGSGRAPQPTADGDCEHSLPPQPASPTEHANTRTREPHH